MNTLIFYPVDSHYNIILEYLYDKYPDKITNFVYSNECSSSQLEYRYRRYKDRQSVKSILPHDCNFTFFTKNYSPSALNSVWFKSVLKII